MRKDLTDKKKDYYSSIYGMESFTANGLVTHELLASIMPFYCCWLPDAEDESKPCKASVTVGSMLFAARTFDMAYNPEKVWIN